MKDKNRPHRAEVLMAKRNDQIKISTFQQLMQKREKEASITGRKFDLSL